MAAILASEPSSIGGVLDQAFRLFRIGVRGLLPYTIAAAVVTLAMQLVQFRMLGRAGVGGTALTTPRPSLGFALVLMLMVLVFLIIHISALHRLAGLNEGTGSTGESWGAGRDRAGAVIGAALLLGLLAVVAALVVGIPVGGLVGGGRGFGVVAFVVVTVAVLAAIYLAVRVMYFVPEIALRKAGPVDSLRGSWRITRGHFWRITVLLTVLVLVMFALYAIFIVVVAAVLGVLGRSGQLSVTSTVLVTDVLSSLLVLLTLPLSLGTTLAIWHDLRLRAEGTDIAARINALPPGR
jgi:hypothetical protein